MCFKNTSFHISNTPKNTIKVTIPFSFKGVEHTPSSIIDLDALIQSDQLIHNTFHHVANDNKIDNYSYEYEVLESSRKIFSEPTGLATNFLKEGDFDLDGYKKYLAQENVVTILQSIASEVLNINNLDDQADIKSALIKAFEAGRETV